MKKKPTISELIKFPVKCDDYGMYITDADGNMLVQVRGWGRLQKLGEEQGIEAQKIIGDAFAFAINERHAKITLR